MFIVSAIVRHVSKLLLLSLAVEIAPLWLPALGQQRSLPYLVSTTQTGSGKGRNRKYSGDVQFQRFKLPHMF